MKRVHSWILAVLAFGCLTAMAWAQVGGNVAQRAAAELGSQGVASEPESKIVLWEPLVSDKFQPYEKVALIANVFVALAGLAYALMLVKQVRRRPAGNRADAGDRPGRSRRRQRLLIPAVPRCGRPDRRDHGGPLFRRPSDEYAPGNLHRPGRRLLPRLDLLGDGGIRGNAAGHDRQPARRSGRPG